MAYTIDIPSVLPWFRGWQLMTAPFFSWPRIATAPPTSPWTARRSPLRRDQCLGRLIPMDSPAPLDHGLWWAHMRTSYMGMDQYLLIPFLVGWTSIYQLFWCSPGVQGFDTLPYVVRSRWLNIFLKNHVCLVGGFCIPTPLKNMNMSSSMGFGWHPIYGK